MGTGYASAVSMKFPPASACTTLLRMFNTLFEHLEHNLSLLVSDGSSHYSPVLVCLYPFKISYTFNSPSPVSKPASVAISVMLLSMIGTQQSS